MDEKITTKSLDNIEYELDSTYFLDNSNENIKHKPEISIIPFLSFGWGTRLNFEKDTYRADTEIEGWEGYIIRPGDAVYLLPYNNYLDYENIISGT